VGVAAAVAVSAAGNAEGSSVRLQALGESDKSKETAKSRLRLRRMTPVLAVPAFAGYLNAVMFGCRTAIGLGSFALALASASACGGAVAHNDDVPSAGQSHGGTHTAQAGSRSGGGGGGGATGRAGSGGSSGAVSAGGSLTDPPPVDEGCPMQQPPQVDMQCDPFNPGECGAGSGCYPFVDHPQGSGCDQQRYGTVCLSAGQGKQGDLCGDDVGDFCAAGFVCVVGQRAGKRCAALCQPGATDQCTGGLICGDLDVAGFGVCG